MQFNLQKKIILLLEYYKSSTAKLRKKCKRLTMDGVRFCFRTLKEWYYTL